MSHRPPKHKSAKPVVPNKSQSNPKLQASIKAPTAHLWNSWPHSEAHYQWIWIKHVLSNAVDGSMEKQYDISKSQVITTMLKKHALLTHTIMTERNGNCEKYIQDKGKFVQWDSLFFTTRQAQFSDLFLVLEELALALALDSWAALGIQQRFTGSCNVLLKMKWLSEAGQICCRFFMCLDNQCNQSTTQQTSKYFSLAFQIQYAWETMMQAHIFYFLLKCWRLMTIWSKSCLRQAAKHTTTKQLSRPGSLFDAWSPALLSLVVENALLPTWN